MVGAVFGCPRAPAPCPTLAPSRALRNSRSMWPLVWMLPLGAATGMALAVVVGVRGETWPRLAAFVYAALLGASALALTVYVASEDDHRRGGISRWQAYDAHAVTVAAIAVGLGAAVASAPLRDAVPALQSSASRVACRVRPVLRRLPGELAQLVSRLTPLVALLARHANAKVTGPDQCGRQRAREGAHRVEARRCGGRLVSLQVYGGCAGKRSRGVRP